MCSLHLEHCRRMNLTNSLLLLLINVVLIVQGLECWQCSARSHDECMREGQLMSCPSKEDICTTIVRRYMSTYQIQKQCKQRDSCWNDREQNWDKYGGRNQCNEQHRSSVCTCCCGKDACNRGDTCQAEIASPKCPQQRPSLQHGHVTCTNRNRLGSKCLYSCTEPGYSLNPYHTRTSQCMGDGQWTPKPPCCTRPCPPYVPFDLMWAITRQIREDQSMVERTLFSTFMKQREASKETFRLGRIIYSDTVHPGVTLNLTLDWQDVDFRKLTQGLRFLPPYKGIVNTGLALRYLRDHAFGKGHWDLAHADVIILVTDKKSDDDVKVAAKALRDDGVIIYAVFLKHAKSDEEADMQELLDIAGEKEHIFVIKDEIEGVEGTGGQIADELMSHLCQNLCE